MAEIVDVAARIQDNVEWTLFGPDGEVKSHGTTHNLVTQVGIQAAVERAYGVSGAGALPIGMKLGTGVTAASATGAGAVLGTYLSGSNALFDSTWPKSSLVSLSRRMQFQCSWAAGIATTATPITEAVLFNDANANATSASGATMARAIISPGVKGALDSLVVVWNADFLPA